MILNDDKIFILGDTHGDFEHWQSVILPAMRKSNVSTVLQLGDFGYWPRTKDGRSYLQTLERALSKMDSRVIFIDGNHEDFQELNKLKTATNELVAISPHIWWAQRARTFTINGITFLALGGAYSVDRDSRVLNSGHYGWFREEVLTAEDVSLAKAVQCCDVILTHDTTYKLLPILNEQLPAGGRLDLPADENARYIQEVVDVVRPKLLFHGHWHHFQEAILDRSRPFSNDPPDLTKVIGLTCDGRPNSFLQLELPSLIITHEKSLLSPKMQKRYGYSSTIG